MFARPGFGWLIPRKSVDLTQPEGFRHQWINRNPVPSAAAGVAVMRLQQTNETPVIGSMSTSLEIYTAATGPDAMIAVGYGGVIRRYPNGLDSAITPVGLEIAPAIQLKGSSRAGHEYFIDFSMDGQKWNPFCTLWLVPENR